MTWWLMFAAVARPQLFEYGVLDWESTLPDASLVMKVLVPCKVTPTSRDAWLLNLGRNRLRPTLSKVYVFWMIVPAAMSWLTTSVNSLSPSSMAPVPASVKSWARRASDSMMRSSTTSCAILAAFPVVDLSKATTFGATLTVGIVGRIHTGAEAEAGPELLGGGGAAPAELETQPPMAGPAPTASASVGVDPSASPAAGSGLCVERSAATGRVPTNIRATASATGSRQLRRRLPALSLLRFSSGAKERASAKRRAQAITRLPRIAVFVQNSSVVGASSSTDRMATTMPNAILATGPSGTVCGSGIIKSPKTRSSGDVTRICQRSHPHIGATCQLATMQWSGTAANARAVKAANPAIKANSSPSNRSSHAINSPPTIRTP